uniref:uncharacterized protein LOC122584971 n=1 Tax=Erigeron canadensis TaxID=72917 RepID=UPI001CB8D5AF|nr:uncharacterized protein LOC122584971 [Erigeron canadensis]
MGKLMHNTQIKHSSHPHLLQLSPTLHLQNQQNCAGCNLQISSHDHTEQVYTCAPCGFFLHQSCTKFPQLITHPSHREHSLSLLPTPIYPGGFFRCDACTQHGTKFSYHCHFCDYDLHVLCASKPLSTNHPFHPHPLVLTFSSPYGEKLGFSCDVCQSVGSCDQWLYRCNSCEFDVHLHCALVKVQPHQQPQPHPQPPPLQHTYSFPGAAQPNHSMAAAGQPLPHSMSTGHIQPNYWQPQPQPMQNNPQPQPSSFQQPPQQVGIQSNYNMPMQTSGPAMNNNNNNQNNGLADVIVTGFVEGMAQQLGQDLVQSLTGGGNDGGNNNNYDGTASTNDEY